MLIKVEVPDTTHSIILISQEYNPNQTTEGLELNVITQYAKFGSDQLQSMIVSDEPCKWCAIEAEIEPCCGTCENINGTKTNVCHDCDGQSRFYPMKHFCGYCGREFRKDVSK